jgi:hypothetical protein
MPTLACEVGPRHVLISFQRTVWQPRDVNEIAISATLGRGAALATLRLIVAATDLEMAQDDERFTDKLDVFLIERDDDALHDKVTGRTLSLLLLPATYQRLLREGIPIEQPLRGAKDAGSVRVVVVDRNSGRMGSVTIPANAIP